MPLLAFVADPAYPWPPLDIDRGADAEALARFVTRVKSRHMVKPLASISAFRENLMLALIRAQTALSVRSEPPQAHHLPSLLDQLYAGPGDPGFAAARQAVKNKHLACPPRDRAAARGLMAERGWYIAPLMQDDFDKIEDVLEGLFLMAVIPDLDAAGVRDELARWVDEHEAPVLVVRALAAAADRQGGTTPTLMTQILQPALSRRWLREHGIDLTSPSLPVKPGIAGAARRRFGTPR